ncbi:hypothetical protein IKQ74_00205 [Candidatus Saccharibacteria bacterium]|nr:hypothetical protein [Candidatus Saccharibacteria bacterium]
MKELAEDFKAIWKKDRGLLCWMAVNLLLNVWLFLLPIVNFDPGRPKIWARYSDISSGYEQSNWWYLFSFSLVALALGIGHTVVGAKLFMKRGKDIARLFLGVSIAITIVALRFLMSILGEG